MAAPIFLNIEQLMTLIASELPRSLYPDDRADSVDPNKRSYSSSELRAHAAMFAQLYTNLQYTYQDKFISTVTEDGLVPWEKELFSAIQDSTLSYTTRQQNLLSKYRAQGGISYPIIHALVAGILDPVGLSFDLICYSGQNYNGVPTSWVLDYTPLDEFTYLAAQDPLWGEQAAYTPLDCSLNYAAAGITEQDLLDIQATAYTYEIRIYGTADASTLALLDSQLTALEPARSTHVITNDASMTDDPSIYGYSSSFLYWYKS